MLEYNYTRGDLETLEDFCNVYTNVFKEMYLYLQTPEVQELKGKNDRFAIRRAFLNHFINISEEEVRTGVEFAALLFEALREDSRDKEFNRNLLIHMKKDFDISNEKGTKDWMKYWTKD